MVLCRDHHGVVNSSMAIYQCSRYRIFTEEEVTLVDTVSAFIGDAVSCANMFEEEKRHNEMLADQKRQLEKQNAELIEARTHFETASSAKSDFLAMVSHELRTPMNAVLGIDELLLDTQLTDEQTEFCNVIRSSGCKLLDIINSIIDTARLEQGKLIPEMKECDVGQCIESVMESFSEPAFKKGLKLSLFIDPFHSMSIVSDVRLLRRILEHLIGNAVKFTSQGEVRVMCMSQDSTLQIFVADSGDGIDTERVPRLFQRFSQMDSSASRKYGGTGLGLYLSRKKAELLGGSLTLNSTELGLGSVFEL